eukprot:1210341-Ditylum_brightwellii.AAC.1
MGDALLPYLYHSATPIVLDSTSVRNTDECRGHGGGRVNYLVIFGDVKGTYPYPQTGHCATLLEDNKTMLIYSGLDPCGEDFAWLLTSS